MKKQILSLTLLLMLFSHQAQAQNKVVKAIGCGVAVAQLLNYANQVNGFYYAEYQNGIPNQRCPASVYDPAWGRLVPVHPMLVQNCRQQHLVWLNQWYAQQANYVNNWQGQIVNSCFTKPPKKDEKINRNDDTAKIDTEQLEELEIGVDEEKSIKITIPKTAEGYKPR
jgi:hypothetical protein